jgi:1-aminocyclopropane-1-carboxylate deaminase/D-cysteine desulfhydrase-like pyridoxal-dependent ACC family enzyme
MIPEKEASQQTDLVIQATGLAGTFAAIAVAVSR